MVLLLGVEELESKDKKVRRKGAIATKRWQP
jgi:hypothetical protein